MPLDPADRLGSGIVLNGWYMDQEVDAKFGREGYSSDSLSFNDVDEQLMRRLYHLVYSCQNDEVGIGHLNGIRMFPGVLAA